MKEHRRILVVDDEPQITRVLRTTLSSQNYDIRVANDGETALERLDSFKPHVVLLDISLPGLKGDEVARIIRQRQPERDVLLVAVTGWGRQEDRARSLQSGFDYHLVKPVEVQTLQSLLSTGRTCRDQ